MVVEPIKCDCGLLYCPDVSGDVRRHKRQHDEWAHGVKAAATTRSPQIIGAHQGYRLTIVPPTASVREREIAEKVGRIGNRETRYDFGVYHARGNLHDGHIHAALAWQGDRAIGILVLDQRQHEHYVKWSEKQPGRGYKLIKANRPRWSVGYVWIMPAHRRNGVASALVVSAARFAGVSVTEFGWLTPFTEAGEALARRQCPDGFWLIG